MILLFIKIILISLIALIYAKCTNQGDLFYKNILFKHNIGS